MNLDIIYDKQEPKAAESFSMVTDKLVVIFPFAVCQRIVSLISIQDKIECSERSRYFETAYQLCRLKARILPMVHKMQNF